MLEERTVIDNAVETMGTQQMKPQQLLNKILHNLEKDKCEEAKTFVSGIEKIRGRFRRAKVKAQVLSEFKVPKNWAQMKKIGIPAVYTTLEDDSQFLR